MKIKVLGSGSSGNCYFVSDGKTSILLDAGIPIKKIEIGTNFSLSSVSACLLSHEHNDHSKAARELAKFGVNIYSSAGTFDALKVTGHRFRTIDSGKKFTVGTFDILPFDLKHDAACPLGYLLQSSYTGEKLVFVTDTMYIRYLFSGLTHIICEANHSAEVMTERVESGLMNAGLKRRIRNSHMAIDTLLEWLLSNDLSQVKQIYLAHLSDDNADADAFKLAVQKKTGAEVIVC